MLRAGCIADVVLRVLHHLDAVRWWRTYAPAY